MRGPRDSARTLEVMVVDQRISSTCSRNSVEPGKPSLTGRLRQTIEQADGQVVGSGVHFHAERFFTFGEEGVGESAAHVNVHGPQDALTRLAAAELLEIFRILYHWLSRVRLQ